MSSVWTNISNGSEKLNQVLLGITIGPMFYSPLDAKYAASVMSQVVSTSVGWDALTIKHMVPSVVVSGIGMVTSSTLSKNQCESTQESTKTLCDLISSHFSE